MTIPTITDCPPAPSRSSDTPSQFSAKADLFAEYIEGMPAEYNAFADGVAATVSGVDFNATSASSVAVGTGSKAFTVVAGKLWQVGQWVVVASAANTANYMIGQVQSYVTTTLTITVPAGGTGGSGTYSDWRIGLSPPPADYLTTTGVQTMTGKTIDLTDNTLVMSMAELNIAISDANLRAFPGGAQTETTFAITDGAAFAIDPRNGLMQRVTLAANRTPVVANFDDGDAVELMIAGSGFTVDWTTIGVVWMNARPDLALYGFTTVRLWKQNSIVYGALIGEPVNSGIKLVGYAVPVTGQGSASTLTPSINLTGLTGGCDNQARAGDLVVVGLFASSQASDLNLTMSTAGYTEAGDQVATSVSVTTNLGTYHKTMGSSPDATAQVSIPGTNTGQGYVILAAVFRGVDQTTPIDVTATTANSTTSILADPPSITPITMGAWIVSLAGCAHSNGAGNFTVTGASSSTVGNYNATTNDIAGAIGVVRRNPLSAVDPAAWTHSVADTGSVCNASITLALRPAI